jgi:hypothetical protein
MGNLSGGMAAGASLLSAVAGGLLLRQAIDETSDAIPQGGAPVNRVGIINWDGSPQVRLRSAPDTQGDNIIAHLPFNTQVQVLKRFPGGWYFVSTPDGRMGYVAEAYVWTRLPEPNARLHRVESGRGAEPPWPLPSATTASTPTTGARTCAFTSTCWRG